MRFVSLYFLGSFTNQLRVAIVRLVMSVRLSFRKVYRDSGSKDFHEISYRILKKKSTHSDFRYNRTEVTDISLKDLQVDNTHYPRAG